MSIGTSMFDAHFANWEEREFARKRAIKAGIDINDAKQVRDFLEGERVGAISGGDVIATIRIDHAHYVKVSPEQLQTLEDNIVKRLIDVFTSALPEPEYGSYE